jgi:hypothetical protein
MKPLNLLAGSLLLFPLLVTTPAQAQRVSADIRIGGGPVSGRVRIDSRDGYRPRRLRVERIRLGDRGRDYGWFDDFRRDARIVVLYYDGQDDFYYDRGYPGLEEIRIYERDGRYYRIDDDRRGYDNRSYGRYDDGNRGGFDRRDNRSNRRDDRFDDGRSRSRDRGRGQGHNQNGRDQHGRDQHGRDQDGRDQDGNSRDH